MSSSGSLALNDKIRMIDPVIAELVGIKEAAWMVRDGVGLERSLLLEAMGAETLTVERGSRPPNCAAGERRLAELKMLSARPGVPPELVATIGVAQKELFEKYYKTRDQVDKALIEGRDPPVNQTELVNVSNAAMDFVVAICTGAFDQIFCAMRRRNRRRQSAIWPSVWVLSCSRWRSA